MATFITRVLGARLVAPLLAITLVMPAPTAEVFSPAHVARLRSVTAAAISPDGRSIAYVVGVQRKPLEDPSGPAWMELHVLLPSGETRPFVTGEVNVESVHWAPDGKSIAYISKRGADKAAGVYAIPVDGGESRRIISHKTDITDFALSPDGRRAAFIASVPPTEAEEKLKEKGFGQDVYEDSRKPSKVWVVALDAETAPAKPLDLAGHPSGLQWSPVGSLLALALAPTSSVDDSYMGRRVHVVDIDSGKVVLRIENPGKLGALAWSPDGARLAYIGAEDVHDPSPGRLTAVEVPSGASIELLPSFEGEVDGIAWQDARTVVYTASVGVWSILGEISVDRGSHRVRIPEGRMVLSSPSVSRDGREVALLADAPSYPPEVHVLGEGYDLPRRITNVNPWLSQMRFARQEVVQHKARDGLSLEGLLIRPLDEEPGKAYPLILSVHGGPEAHERNGWLTSYGKPGQTAAARGFAVFYPNYRGSTGRGVSFSKLGQGDPAGKEFDDLIDAVDHLVSTGLVDKTRVGVTGGSYGGYATAWCSTRHSSRFRAGVMFVGISDLVSKLSTTDIPEEEYLVHSRTRLWDDLELFLDRSPIRHAQGATTPLLILHGKDDTRVHPGQSLELYRNLKQFGKAPVRLVYYPGEGHGNRNSAARLDYNLRMLQWLEHYLKGPGGEPPGYELEYGKKAEKPENAEPASKADEKTP